METTTESPTPAAVEPAAAPGRVHFPCFEGLRALAAVMVVVHHASSLAGESRSPGFVHRTASVLDSGVAVFFVISGFLIYRPYVVAHLAGRAPIRARAFFWRRLLRLVPAYWLALTFFWYLGNFDLGHDWWRYYLFAQIYSSTTTLGGLVQAWSLCTEVTFYLMVPVLAGALCRLVKRGSTPRAVATLQLGACAALYASGFVARQLISHRNPRWRGLSFQWLPTNIDLFAVGMAIAVVSAWASTDGRLRARVDRLASIGEVWWVAGIALFAWYAARVGPASFAEGYRGWFWQQRQLVLGLVTALLLVPVVFGPQDRGAVRWLLRTRPVAWIGMVSYGLYLWHFDWMKRVIENRNGITGQVAWPGWAHSFGGDTNLLLLLGVGLGVGSLFAAASWYLLEQPVERFKSLVR
ncbi:MAG: putative integral rane acyltransferase [Acidimicrobiales bacterium]|nr:putative integral rane acyltransferase [Acidimicrobiales bacterium]